MLDAHAERHENTPLEPARNRSTRVTGTQLAREKDPASSTKEARSDKPRGWERQLREAAARPDCILHFLLPAHSLRDRIEPAP
jgi:hypothetical protein